MKYILFCSIMFIVCTALVCAAPEPYGGNEYKEGPYGKGTESASEGGGSGETESTPEQTATTQSASVDDNPGKTESDASTVKGNDLQEGGCVTGCGDAENGPTATTEQTTQSQVEQVRPRATSEAPPTAQEAPEETPSPSKITGDAVADVSPTEIDFRPVYALPLLLVMVIPLLLLVKKRKKEKERVSIKEKALSSLKEHRL